MKKASRFSLFLKKIIPLIFILTSFLGCGGQQKYAGDAASTDIHEEKWMLIEESTLGFRTKFPGQWKHRLENMETDKGMAPVHIFEFWHVAFMYGITVVNFPPGVSDMSDPDKVLEYAVSSFIDEHKGELVFQKRFNFSGYPAMRAKIKLDDSFLKNAYLNTIIILRNNLVYRVSTSGIGNDAFIKYYLDAFELTPVRY